MSFDGTRGLRLGERGVERERISVLEGLELLLEDAESMHIDMNRRATVRAARMADVIEHARSYPSAYGMNDRGDAQRSAVLELALRLHLAEPQVQGIFVTVSAARRHLPLLWARALEGFVQFAQLELAVSASATLVPSESDTDSARAARIAAVAEFDAHVAELAMRTSLSAFRMRVRRLVTKLSERLGLEIAARRHAEAMTQRRVIVEPAGDGMAWVSAFVPLVDALAIKRRLTSTAKHRQKILRQGRSRDQLRADLFCEWLTGAGTNTAVQTKVFVTIPLDVLAGRRRPGVAPLELAEIVGHGVIDSATARQIFFDSKAFHRLAIDPISGVMLDMDRRTYRPTIAQRDWLVLQSGVCARDGCDRLALDADIDHQHEWAEGGATNIANLVPLCPADHVARHRSQMRFRRRENNTVEVTSPTGFRTHELPPF